MRKAFLASKALGLRLLQSIELDGALILHPDDRQDNRSVWPEFEALGARMVSSRSEADDALRAFRPDIVFVCGWYWLIPDDVLALADRGFYGIHNSLLPQYRGGAPLVWAIINGEREVGSTLFRLEGGVDDGAIAHQVRIEIDRRETIADATRLVEEAWEREFPAIWGDMCDGTAALTAQDVSGNRQWPNRKPTDGEIDWSLPAAQVHDFIRAQCAPYPGAFASFGTIEASEETWLRLSTPIGQVVRLAHGQFVRCGDGRALKISLRGGHSGSTSMPSSSERSVQTGSSR
jgi:methionyl-tRNA formyltransferase